MSKRGRKSKYSDPVRETILRLLKDGKTEAEIAEIVGVCTKTFSNWKGSHPELLHAVNEAKQVADSLVEVALFRRAIGYVVPEEKVIVTKQGDVVPFQGKKHLPPDTTAAMFWLRNRQPKRWREKNEADVNVHQHNDNKLSDEQLEAKIAAMLAKHMPTDKPEAEGGE